MNGKTNMKEFERAVRPAMEWRQKNGNPHQKIIIEMDGAGLVSGEMFVPENMTEAANESED